MKPNTITRKIKLIGILFIILMSSIIATTIYLNGKNQKDALIINIAGKQRMLTQKISKNIFYLYNNDKGSYTELDNSTIEFIYNLKTLKEGNNLAKIYKAPTDGIAEQIKKVEIQWKDFNININKFKEFRLIRNSENEYLLKNIVNTIYNTNTVLLSDVDLLVSMYTAYTEEKTNYFKYIQYLFGVTIIFLMIYSFIQLKAMEANAKKFFEFSKKVSEVSNDELLEPIQIEAEKEIVDATDTINCFINKINTAMMYSANAVEESKNAAIKLEEITDEFDIIINELTNSAEISKQLNRSEDIAIQTQEELINSTKKLQELKNELDKLLDTCKIK